MHVTELTSVDLPNRPCKPLACRDEPKAKGVQNYNSDSDRCIVERLCIDGVKLRETKHDGDKRDPEHSSAGDYKREPAEMERPAHEAVRVYHTQRDWYP